jgi:hypothetical protein
MEFVHANRKQLIYVALVYAILASSVALIFAVYANSMWKWNFDNPDSLLAQRDIIVEGDLDLMGELRLQGLDTIRCEESHTGESMTLGSEHYTHLTSVSGDAHLWKSNLKRETHSKLADGLLWYTSPSCSVTEPDTLHLGQLLVEVGESNIPFAGAYLERLRHVRFLTHSANTKRGLVQFNYSSLLELFPECTKSVELPRGIYPAQPLVNTVDVEQMLMRALIAIQELAEELDNLKSA